MIGYDTEDSNGIGNLTVIHLNTSNSTYRWLIS